MPNRDWKLSTNWSCFWETEGEGEGRVRVEGEGEGDHISGPCPRGFYSVLILTFVMGGWGRAVLRLGSRGTGVSGIILALAHPRTATVRFFFQRLSFGLLTGLTDQSLPLRLD